jgi:hypothetical protein
MTARTREQILADARAATEPAPIVPVWAKATLQFSAVAELQTDEESFLLLPERRISPRSGS